MTYRLLIGGKLVDGASTLDVINPATGRPFAVAPRADAAQLDQAIASAKAAFPAWSAKSYADRASYMIRIADAIEARLPDLARLLTEEQGKPLAQAQFEVGGAAAAFRIFAGMTLETKILREDADNRIIQQRGPLGVVAAIAPWNFPLMLMACKIAPALISGNTVIAKPAPTTPLTTLVLGEIAADILPAGVLSTIVDANDLGAQLTAHPDVAKVSFTGSTATGKKVMASVATTLKRLTLELGGNDAAIVLDDADVAATARNVFAGATMNAGQVCLAIKRVYVPRAMYDAFCDELAQIASEAIVDDGLAQGVQIGPLQNRQQFDKVKAYLESAKATGKVIAGGEALDRDGYFIAPTIVRDISDDAPLVREEQFGPVLPVLAYDDIDDAIARANDSEYGLGGTVWTSDVERGYQVASRIESGTVWVNRHLDMPFDIPFGGAKQSGIGVEFGEEGMAEFTQRRVINMALTPAG